ncbi:MAG TPA: hypothetical protein VF550_05440 [Polyangia bacterium]
MLDRLKRGFPYLAATAALIAVFAWALRKFLIGEAFPIWDADGLFGPYYMLIADFARHGKLLWWNPWANGGQPDFMDLQYGAHSPVVFVMGWLFGPSVRGFIAYWLTIWLLFGLGILALARQWKLPAWGSLVVALGLTFSGFFVGHAEHTPVLFSWVWMPMVLWRLEVALARSSWAAGAQAGVLFGLSALGGYPAILFTNGVFLLLWIPLRIFFREEPDGADGRPAATPAKALQIGLLMFAVAALIALPGFYNFFHEGRGFTNRTGVLEREIAVMSNALHPRALLTFASPYLATLTPGKLWEYTDISSCSLYAGGLVFVFAVFSMLVRPRSRLRWALFAGIALAIAASLARTLPLRGWLYDWVPPTRYFRHASWFRAYAIFFLGLLALLGIRDFVNGVPGVNRKRRLMAAATFSVIVAGAAYWAVLARAHPANHTPGDIHFLFAWVGPALVVACLRPSRFAQSCWWVPTAFCLLAATDAVLSAGLANTMAVTGDGPKRKWAEVNRQHRSEIDLLHLDGAKRSLRPRSGDRDNRHFLTREAALYSYSGLRNNLQDAWIAQPILVASATSENRFWFTSETVRSPPCVDAYNAFLQRTWDLGVPPLVVHDKSSMLNSMPCAPDELQRVSQAPAAIRAAVTLERYEPDALTLRFEAPQDGWLLVTDRWAAGWVAKVNGSPAPVEGGNFIFRALPVRAGSNRVALTYEPPGHPWLPVLDWAFIAAVLAASWWPSFQRWRRKERASAGEAVGCPSISR